MLGLLVGVGFFILKLDDYFQELSVYKKLSRKVEERVEDIKERNDKKSSKRNIKINKIPTQPDSIISTDEKPDTLQNELTSLDSTVQKTEEEIIVRKDELIASKNIDIINIADTKQERDTIMQQVSGVKEDYKSPNKIEFWKSPINYKGYKMTRNKIVLYGINATDPFSVFKIDDAFYLKHLTNVYKLEYTNDFKQFEKVSDPSLQAKLNK